MSTETAHIATPYVILAGDTHSSQEIRITHAWFARSAEPRLGIDRLQTHSLHESSYAFAIYRISLLCKKGDQLPLPVKRRPCILFIKQAHQEKIFLTLRDGFIIVTGTGQPQQLTLTDNRQVRMLRLDEESLLLNGKDQIFF